MKLKSAAFPLLLMSCLFLGSAHAARVKDIARVEGVRDNSLVGYGIVVGLSGTGDSARAQAGIQSVANTLARFGVTVDRTKFVTRNSAAVLVTGELPPFTNIGDRIDVTVSSIGDARSLVGGTLFMTPLQAADGKTYALAQGAMSIGGFRYDAFGNVVQKNHPTVGLVPSGAIVEAAPSTSVVSRAGSVFLLLSKPDFTTAQRVAEAISRSINAPAGKVTAEGPDRIVVRLNPEEKTRYVEIVQRIEAVGVDPDFALSVVVNERTGTIVSGGDVRLAQVTVSQGDLRISVTTDYLVSQPGLILNPGQDVRTTIVPDAEIRATESAGQPVALPEGASVLDLVTALNKVRATPRDIIGVLSAIERAGALNARLIIQ